MRFVVNSSEPNFLPFNCPCCGEELMVIGSKPAGAVMGRWVRRAQVISTRRTHELTQEGRSERGLATVRYRKWIDRLREMSDAN